MTEPSTPSFSNDVAASRHRSVSPHDSGEWHTVGPGGIVLRDPVTGTPRTGSSTSGREAARVVKFSPEGSERDLMVFSEVSVNSIQPYPILNELLSKICRDLWVLADLLLPLICFDDIILGKLKYTHYRCSNIQHPPDITRSSHITRNRPEYSERSKT